ncbi:homoserine kinase [Calorimonas adulescens]|jgi:homoserine kinase|uniref:Homoserine kinase n=1 Tax=Calorimonas adulescens TaxID=2606906 RepID=A0A5D8QG38_9THEO|nr:homoserine kinase [Calorimonas adulescens]TZE83189.1 homoserine kinase [Calorimonas adulescens]
MRVRVPASTANLGPGFDCFGLALDIYDFVELRYGEPEDNLAYLAFRKALEYKGMEIPTGLRCSIYGDIPASRGLGSSAACIIGGLILANKYMDDTLSEDEILSIACEIEGHPDNVVPALKGGFHISYLDGGKIKSTQVPVPDNLIFAIMVPEFPLSTERARAVLPRSISYADAVYNISRASLLIKSFVTSDFSLMKEAFNDRLHQPYRLPIIPEARKIMDMFKASGCLGYFLSGSGSSIIGVFDNKIDANKLVKGLNGLKGGWQMRTARPDKDGALVDGNS